MDERDRWEVGCDRDGYEVGGEAEFGGEAAPGFPAGPGEEPRSWLRRLGGGLVLALFVLVTLIRRRRRGRSRSKKSSRPLVLAGFVLLAVLLGTCAGGRLIN